MKSNAHLFSIHNSITYLQYCDIPNKINRLKIVFFARADYEEPNSAIVHQAIS